MAKSFFGGGTKSIPTETETRIRLPEWVESGGKEIFDKSKPLAERGYPSFPVGDRVAPFTPDQMKAFDMVRSSTGAYQPLFNKGTAAIDNYQTPVGEADIKRYMDPYQENVIQASMDRILNQAAQQRIARNSQQAKSGSYLTEDRRAIVDNVANEGTNRVIAELVASLSSQGFQNALNQANTERGRQGEAAKLYGTYAPMGQQLSGEDINRLLTSGSLQQAQEQDLRTMTYEDFINNFYYPQEQLNWRQSLLAGLPYGQTQTTTGQQLVGKSSILGGLLGGASSIAGMGGPNGFGFWGGGAGAGAAGSAAAMSAAGITPGLSSIMGAAMLSSKKAKDVKGKVKTDELLEKFRDLDVSAWTYKPEIGDPALHVGPMAEDFQKTFGLGDGKTINVVDAVGVLTGAVKELVDKLATYEGASHAAA